MLVSHGDLHTQAATEDDFEVPPPHSITQRIDDGVVVPPVVKPAAQAEARSNGAATSLPTAAPARAAQRGPRSPPPQDSVKPKGCFCFS